MASKSKISAKQLKQLEALASQLLVIIGEDPKREGLIGTPHRYAKWWKEFIDYDPGNTDTVFEAVTAQQMVVVSGMRVWSLCEHHLLPFWCDVSIGYIPNKRVLGLSKFARIAHLVGHRLQVQERMSQQIYEAVRELSDTDDIGVVIRGEHLCMSMRGIKTPALMTSSVLHGAFRDEPDTRAEFLHLSESKR